MSSPSSSVQEARKALGQRLREIRLDAGLTARALAVLAGWHESKCSRYESGARSPSEVDLRAWAVHCGVPHIADDLVTTARGIDGMYVEWRRMERTGLRRAQESVIPLWERTRRFRIYSSWLIPGPVQTGPYIEALLKSIRDRRQLADDVESNAIPQSARLKLRNDLLRHATCGLQPRVPRVRVRAHSLRAHEQGHQLAVPALEVAAPLSPYAIGQSWDSE
jgi:transcriptional regulator with XRE-family HTH domain